MRSHSQSCRLPYHPTLPPHYLAIPTPRHKPRAVRVRAVDPRRSSFLSSRLAAPLRGTYHSSPSTLILIRHPGLSFITGQRNASTCSSPCRVALLDECAYKVPHTVPLMLLHPPAPSACQSADLARNDLGARHSSSSPPAVTRSFREDPTSTG
jgi:hypothetical protein